MIFLNDKILRSHIRKYNQKFGFISIAARINEKLPPGRGPATYMLNGEMSHLLVLFSFYNTIKNNRSNQFIGSVEEDLRTERQQDMPRSTFTHMKNNSTCAQKINSSKEICWMLYKECLKIVYRFSE